MIRNSNKCGLIRPERTRKYVHICISDKGVSKCSQTFSKADHDHHEMTFIRLNRIKICTYILKLMLIYRETFVSTIIELPYKSNFCTISILPIASSFVNTTFAMPVRFSQWYTLIHLRTKVKWKRASAPKRKKATKKKGKNILHKKY